MASTCACSWAGGEVGTVVRVVDGDSLEVELPDRVEKVRLLGVDTPARQHYVLGLQRGDDLILAIAVTVDPTLAALDFCQGFELQVVGPALHGGRSGPCRFQAVRPGPYAKPDKRLVHDAGRVINPLIVDGQVHGGVAQGIGNAFYEQLVFDDQGQLLCPSFMDYLLPTSLDVPRVDVGHMETPSPLNPMGVKGAGEAGAIPTGALFAQAVEDALVDFGLEVLEIPLSPNRLWELVEQGREGT